jgi:transposase-like protein
MSTALQVPTQRLTTEAAILEHRSRQYQDYSPEQKAEVIAQCKTMGSKAVSRLRGIPRQTIDYWIKEQDRYAQIQPEITQELANKCENIAHNLADSIEDHDLSIVPLAAKATALGIVIDKMQLLRGLPTSINAEVERQELVIILQSALNAGLEGEAIDVTPEPDPTMNELHGPADRLIESTG